MAGRCARKSWRVRRKDHARQTRQGAEEDLAWSPGSFGSRMVARFLARHTRDWPTCKEKREDEEDYVRPTHQYGFWGAEEDLAWSPDYYLADPPKWRGITELREWKEEVRQWAWRSDLPAELWWDRFMYLFSAEDRKKFGSISSDTRLSAHCAEAIIEIWEKTARSREEEDMAEGGTTHRCAQSVTSADAMMPHA